MTITTSKPITSISKLHESIVNACKENGLEIPDIISTTDKLSQYIRLTSDEFEAFIISSTCEGCNHRITRDKDDRKHLADFGFGLIGMHLEDGTSKKVKVEPEDEIQIGCGKGLKDLHPIIQETIFTSIYEWKRLFPEYNGHLEDCYIEEGYPIWFKLIGSAEDVVRVYHEAADIIQLDFDDLMTKAGIPDDEKAKTKLSMRDRFELVHLEPYYRRISMARTLGLL